MFRPNKKVSVFRVTGLKILGRGGTHIFFKYLFSEFFFPENLKNSRFHLSKFKVGSGYPKHRYFFYLALIFGTFG